MPQTANGPHFILFLPVEGAGQRLLILAEGETGIGRSPENDIVIEDPAVSRHHCRVIRRGSRVVFEDLGDRNLTQLRNKPAHGRQLRDGDRLHLGRSSLLFHSGVPVATASPVVRKGVVPRRRASESFQARSKSSSLPMVVVTAVLIAGALFFFLSNRRSPEVPAAGPDAGQLALRAREEAAKKKLELLKKSFVAAQKKSKTSRRESPVAAHPPAEGGVAEKSRAPSSSVPNRIEKPAAEASGIPEAKTAEPVVKKVEPPKPRVVRPVVPKNAQEAYFEAHVVPYLSKYCNACHNEEESKGDLELHGYRVASSAIKDKDVWGKVAKKIKEAKMPPRKSRQPTESETARILAWIDAAVFELDEGKSRDPGRVTMRRLNKVEYNNTVRDLVGLDLDMADAFPADEIGYGFDNISDLLSIPPLLMEKYLTASEKIVKAIWANEKARSRIMICRPEKKSQNKTCAKKIVQAFGGRAFRRPLNISETGALVSLVELAVKNEDGFETGIQFAVQAMLVSPHFLFRVEIDSQPHDPKVVRSLNDYEVASRMSYFLWSSMPDDELLEMARKKSLRKRSVIEAQVKRMLADGKSRAFIKTFAAHWLGTRTMRLVTPDVATFPEFDEKLRDAMCRETELFFEEIMSKDLSILLFIDSDFTFLNQRLAEHYGIPGVRGEKLRRVALKDRRRGGVLTQGTVLTITSDPTRTSPVKRGKWVLEQILGSPPPPPPPGNDNFVGESTKEELTLRARMELHRQKPECAVCHDKMDTIGLGFERFDGVGSFRKTHSGNPIVVSGTFPSGQTFENVGELKALLLRHKADFCRCLTEKMLIFALGRGLEYTDTSLVDEISSTLALNDYRFSTLVKQIVLSAQFRKRRGEQKPLTAVK